jgi:predicted metal-dependent HD superfamily phosphohydrolase
MASLDLTFFFEPCVTKPLVTPPMRGELLFTYRAADRHYHNLNHIAALLLLLREHLDALVNPAAVEAAIWFHDAVYDTHRQDNEHRSAVLAAFRLAEARVSRKKILSVITKIEATKDHVVPDFAPRVAADCALFLDMDLAILGGTPKKFAAYEAAVRREYAWVREAKWRAGRRQVLEKFLARESIYASPQFRVSHEARARKNLAKALAALRG